MKISRVGVDLAKNVFQIHGTDTHGNPVWKRKLSRERWIEAICTKTPEGCEIGMEACAGSHHWARRLSEYGFDVKLIPPQFVTPYVKSNKNELTLYDKIITKLDEKAELLVKSIRRTFHVPAEDVKEVFRVMEQNNLGKLIRNNNGIIVSFTRK